MKVALKTELEGILRGIEESNNGNLIRDMKEVAKILENMEPIFDPLLRAVNTKINQKVKMDVETYFLASYFETKDMDKSLSIYRTVRSLIWYIGLIDIFYEINDREYLEKARELLDTIIKKSTGHLRYSIKFSLKRCWPFWEFEQVVRHQMMKGHIFSNKELSYYNMFKSSDADLYCSVLDNEIRSFNQNVTLLFHYKQALIDILDDLADIEEDFNDRMPNIFILSSINDISFSDLLKKKSGITKFVVNDDTKKKILGIVSEYEDEISQINPKKSFIFLKDLCNYYIKEIRNSLNGL
jgi:hypothetical protein